MDIANRKWEDLSDDERKKWDLAGKRFGVLTVLHFETAKNGYDKWMTRCDCGNESIKDGRNLRTGQVKSCGRYCKLKPRKPRG